MKKIFIIIVNYQSEDVIGEAIKSFNEDEIDFEIVVLDNGSTEDSYKSLRTAIGEDIEIIRNKKNLGYSAGANYVAKYINDNYENVNYFFFFNPDAVATKNMLSVLLNGLMENKTAAAISPLILDMDGKNWFSGTKIEWDDCKINNNPIVDTPKEIRKNDTFNGCAVLLDANRYFEVGMFNEDLFIYYDEPFLSMELLEKGYTCLYEPHAIAHHHVSHTTGSHSTFKNRLMTRNHIQFFKKYGKSNTILCPYLQPLRNALFYLKRFMFSNVYHIMLGIYDALNGKKGLS